MSLVIRALKLTQMENDLLEIEKNIKIHEGIINSVKIRNEKYKNTSKKTLLKLISKKSILIAKITEAIMFDIEV